MKKLLFVSLFVFAACDKDPNVAEIRIKSDVPTAKCASGMLSDGTSVSKCDLPRADEKGIVTVLGAQGGDFPFQVFPFKTSAQLKDDAKAEADARAKAAAHPAPTPTPIVAPGLMMQDASVGSTTGSAGE